MKKKFLSATEFHCVWSKSLFRFLFLSHSIGRPQKGFPEDRGQFRVGDSGATSNTTLVGEFSASAMIHDIVAVSLSTGKPSSSLERNDTCV